MKMNRYHFIRTLIICFIISTFCGCFILKGIEENLAGNYMNGLERTRKNSKTQIFDSGVSECFDKVVTILKGNAKQAKILKIDIYNYSILVSVVRPSMQENTDSRFDGNNADVGIFFTEEGPHSTKVEVNSLSSPFRDYTAKMIFSELQK